MGYKDWATPALVTLPGPRVSDTWATTAPFSNLLQVCLS